MPYLDYLYQSKSLSLMVGYEICIEHFAIQPDMLPQHADKAGYDMARRALEFGAQWVKIARLTEQSKKGQVVEQKFSSLSPRPYCQGQISEESRELDAWNARHLAYKYLQERERPFYGLIMDIPQHLHPVLEWETVCEDINPLLLLHDLEIAGVDTLTLEYVAEVLIELGDIPPGWQAALQSRKLTLIEKSRNQLVEIKRKSEMRRRYQVSARPDRVVAEAGECLVGRHLPTGRSRRVL